MTDNEAFQKYCAELQVEPNCGILVALDDQLEIVSIKHFQDPDILYNTALDLWNENKNFIRISRMEIDEIWYVGNTYTKSANYIGKETTEFYFRRKTGVDLEALKKELTQLASGIFPNDEEGSEYPS